MASPSAILRVYADADVLFAGAVSPSEHSASQVVLALSEITVMDGVTTKLAVEEARRNLHAAFPEAEAPFLRLVKQALRVVDDPPREALLPHLGKAHWKDLPHLVAAQRAGCSYLVTFNTKDYRPGHEDVTVLRPGALLRRIRLHLAAL